MSPLHIVNPDLYVDRTVQDWHRKAFPSNNWAIDLDLMGACHICREVLYLIESTTNPNKATTIMRNLARRANTCAFIIFHQNGVVTGGRLVWPTREGYAYTSAESLAQALTDVRAAHMQAAHPRYYKPKESA